jgi:hypothetical protein
MLKKVFYFSIFLLTTLTQTVFAADYSGARAAKGSSRGEACEKAANSAASAARAAGPVTHQNDIAVGKCECEKVSDSETFGWECTVSWNASAKK